MKKIEHQEQIKLVNYLSILERQGKIITFFAIPNGGSRNAIEAKNLKREGIRAGVSDIQIILKNKVLFIEMKRQPKVLKSGKLSYTGINISDMQKEFINKVNNSDVCSATICYGFNEAKEYIDNALKNNKGQKLINRDYTYCNSSDCKKRKKCKRWIGNYKNYTLTEPPYMSFLIDDDCKNNNFELFDALKKIY